MNRNYFYRAVRNYFAVIALFLVVICLFIGIFCWYGRGYACVPFQREYYLLVRECEDTTAAAVVGDVYASGGAAYLYRSDAVALACYFTLEDAEQVRNALLDKNVEADVLRVRSKRIYLYGEHAVQCGQIQSNLSTVQACAELLYDVANGLEKANYSQEEARARVVGVVNVLSGLQRQNEGEFYGEWNQKLEKTERKGEQICGGILFAKDVRYLQTQLCIDIADAAECFP